MRILILLGALLSGTATAQMLDTRPGDARDPLGRTRRPVCGARELIFFDDGVSHFYNDGRYTFAYDLGRGGYAYGYFEVAEDSTVCITFVNGLSRCDAYVEKRRPPDPDQR